MREEGGERERVRERSMRERNIDWLPSHRFPGQRPNPQPQYVPCVGIEPTTFWFMGQYSNQLIHTSQGYIPNFKCVC